MQVRMTLGGVAFGLLLWGPLATLEAQVTGPGPDGRWPLQPNSGPSGRTEGDRLGRISPHALAQGWGPFGEGHGRFPLRELRNVIERGVIVSPGPDLVLSRWQADRTSQVVPDDRRTMRDVERGHIISVLEQTAWQVGGSGGAAEILGMKPTTLRSRMQKLGVKKPTS